MKAKQSDQTVVGKLSSEVKSGYAFGMMDFVGKSSPLTPSWSVPMIDDSPGHELCSIYLTLLQFQ